MRSLVSAASGWCGESMAELGMCRVAQVPEEGIGDGLACCGLLLQEGCQATSTQPLQAQEAAAAAAAGAVGTSCHLNNAH
jgi:hypothetical protein